jgi:hypothetical protein
LQRLKTNSNISSKKSDQNMKELILILLIMYYVIMEAVCLAVSILEKKYVLLSLDDQSLKKEAIKGEENELEVHRKFKTKIW